MSAAESPPQRNRLHRLSRVGPLGARIVVALFGGYALGALASVAALALPLSAAQAVITGMLTSFLVYAGVAVWAFLGRSGSGVRQSMSDLHTWAGLLAGWLLYAMFLTGTVSYFKDEISQWMRPELAYQRVTPDPAAVAQRTVTTLGTVAAGGSQWFIQLPTARSNTVSVFWRTPNPQPGKPAFGLATFDPSTGKKLVARDTLGGQFFYRFHYQFYYLPAIWGRWLAGLCAMFKLVAIVSGVITHKKIFVDFFTFRWGRGQRSWLDAHNADLPALKDFILPGGGEAAARCHLARTIVRRAEREAVTLARHDAVRPQAIRYLNRLSDLLFVLARVLARVDGHGEVIWKHERRR